MNDMNLKIICRFGAACLNGGQVKSSRHALDMFADRVRQASVQPTLLLFGQELCKLLNVTLSGIPKEVALGFVEEAANAESAAILGWIREHHSLYAVLCASAPQDAEKSLEAIDIAEIKAGGDRACPRRAFEVSLKLTCESPLSHGADAKSGNATLFRRMAVLGEKGGLMELPFYAGNALRGQLRDILADHLTMALGLKPSRKNPPYKLWFFHALYSGGALEETSAATKKVASALGDNGVVKSDGVRQWREMLPALSLLGCAMGNRVLPGYVDVHDLRPQCREWGTGQNPVAELMDWLYLTRRDDLEGGEEFTGMIAVTEVLKPGTVLEGGIEIHRHASEMARSALGLALREFGRLGRIGAQNRAGYGAVTVEYEGAPGPESYEDWIHSHGKEILDYLEEIGALHARDAFNL